MFVGSLKTHDWSRNSKVEYFPHKKKVGIS